MAGSTKILEFLELVGLATIDTRSNNKLHTHKKSTTSRPRFVLATNKPLRLKEKEEEIRYE